MSTQKRAALHDSLVRNIRQFIAGTILYNQQVADSMGLHLTDMQCFGVLELLGPVTPGTLAERTGLTTGGVTVMLDRLQKEGFVKRVPNPNDRRSVLVHINEKKMEKIRPYYAEITQQLEAFLLSTPVADIETVVNFLSRMNEIRGERPRKPKSAK
jgi:MarR family transcriptional regulator, organic hydroperoxide resistance regulator